MTNPIADEDRIWRLEKLASLPGIRGVVLAGVDGLRLENSKELSQEQAELLAAATTALHAASMSSAEVMGTTRDGWGGLVVRWDTGWVMVEPAGQDSLLGVLTTSDADLELVAMETDRFVGDIAGAQVLDATPRPLPRRIPKGADADRLTQPGGSSV